METHHPAMSDPHTKRQGFTLIEILITAAILMALAGMAIPAFSGSLEEARQSSASQMLARMRTAIDFYAFQHDEEFPGYDPVAATWSAAAFDNQLRMATDEYGNTAAVGTAGYPFGPYLNDALPVNPYNELASVTIVVPGGTFAGPDDATGWVFFADTGIVRANSSGTTYAGGAVFDL
jgi:prepilin-type N-terminal cleavage/methylation domain-containing protein